MSPAAAILYPLLYFFDTGGWFAALVPTVTFHELGHWAAVRCCGGHVRALRLDMAGLCMDISPLSSRKEEILCAAAGPAAGLLWILPALWAGGSWGSQSALAALVINGFNLLPAAPLDGGRILLALTGDERAVRFSSAAAATVLLFLAGRWAQWRLVIPAALILCSVLRS